MSKAIRKTLAFIALIAFCWIASTNMVWLIVSGLAMPIVLILAIILAG